MVIVGLGQPALGDLFENADKADPQILIRIHIDDAKPKTAILIKAVKRRDDLLPDSLLGMGKQVHDLGQNGRHSLVIDELANSIESSANDKVIVRLEILLDGVDDQDDPIVIVAEEERNGELTGAFEQEIVVMGHLDDVDVGEGC
ncbi:hypothetical protein Pyn_33367 [Prunus yedoensis var. nudiflora]|uniref:Uncharacterized protein n=1 Tax=Prunus yedoensis var. nudiflora TaxID=2094558 RepID=A0A314Z8D1_PRUYE|nr:hypothetical protein Pyn_33367 [Prunus yedoensis var. nudiflora]